MRQWRLIYDKPMTGAYNMAVDEAILHSVAAGENLPTLRLYAWQPLCLSLGYGQRVQDADMTRIQANGWDIVRRPTGGKAILHGNELTYSIALPKNHDLAQGDVIDSYRHISEALLTALTYLGLSPQSEKQAKGNTDLGPVCFEVPSHYEITSDGKKLIGSAQLRRKIGILQHGSFPLNGDITLICDALAYPDDESRAHAKQKVAARATTLESVLNEPVGWLAAAQTIVRGFADTFDIDFEIGQLSAAEEAYTQQLMDEVYANPAWTNKR